MSAPHIEGVWAPVASSARLALGRRPPNGKARFSARFSRLTVFPLRIFRVSRAAHGLIFHPWSPQAPGRRISGSFGRFSRRRIFLSGKATPCIGGKLGLVICNVSVFDWSLSDCVRLCIIVGGFSSGGLCKKVVKLHNVFLLAVCGVTISICNRIFMFINMYFKLFQNYFIRFIFIKILYFWKIHVGVSSFNSRRVDSQLEILNFSSFFNWPYIKY